MLSFRLSDSFLTRKSTVLGVASILAVSLLTATTPAGAVETGALETGAAETVAAETTETTETTVAEAAPAETPAAEAAQAESATSATPMAQQIEVTGSVALSEIQRDESTVNEPGEAVADSAEEVAAEEVLPPAPAPAVEWVNPTTGTITSSFGPRPNKPVAGVNPFHKGTDIADPAGTPIHAAFTGTVVQAGVNGTYGNWILIDHGNGVQTGYAHNSEIYVSVGQAVASGDVIAAMGSTGASTGPHLHFEVRVNGEPIDAVPFMSERGVTLG